MTGYVLAVALNETSHLPFAPTRFNSTSSTVGATARSDIVGGPGKGGAVNGYQGNPERLLGVFLYYKNTNPELHVFIRGLEESQSLWHLW